MADKKPKHGRGRQKNVHSRSLNDLAQTANPQKEKKGTSSKELQNISPQKMLVRVTRSQGVTEGTGLSSRIPMATGKCRKEKARKVDTAVGTTKEVKTNKNNPNSKVRPGPRSGRDEAEALSVEPFQAEYTYKDRVPTPTITTEVSMGGEVATSP